MSLIVIGGIAYAYSIYTNVQGILHFQGTNANPTWASALGFLMDASAEPLIAWSLGVGREGDFLGNIIKVIASFFNGIFDSAENTNKSKTEAKPPYMPKSGEKSTERRENMPLSSFFADGDRRQKSHKHPSLSGLHGVKSEKSRTYNDE